MFFYNIYVWTEIPKKIPQFLFVVDSYIGDHFIYIGGRFYISGNFYIWWSLNGKQGEIWTARFGQAYKSMC